MGNQTVLIVGAGVSGLVLAQYLRKTGIPFQIFERDLDLATRGLGWGLTLHWSLPALRSLLPDDLVRRLPEVYVDRAAVEAGSSTFPFFDLSTGELKGAAPTASTDTRIRVTRDKFKRLLATGLDIHLFPGQANHQIPVRLIGVKLDVTPEEIEPLRQLDPCFLQGTASENDSYLFFSILDAPGNDSNTNASNSKSYTCHLVMSWPVREGFLDSPSPTIVPETNEGRIAMIKKLALTWAEPFRSLALGIPPATEVNHLNLSDWPPPRGLRTSGSVALVGDALHPMAMYRGEGANHAIVDVLDLVELVVPHLTGEGNGDVRRALDQYEDGVVVRTRRAVLASRQACLDAHDWSLINAQSPLLSRRAMHVPFDESSMS